ncbi:MAG: hypothetical protein GTO02_11805 [Candidatus Dadabacteria bacterium]|nr:hypothetical protein [Candidatus Dadabacteria bacterium]
MKNIKVIATYFGPRRRYPYMIDETIELLREVVALEQILDKGACCDTVIVNHDVTPLLKDGQKAINYLNSIDRIATKNGTLKILNRDWNQGIGGSFGSFSYAFGKLKNQYEYWFFTEDNVVQVRENYIRESIDVIKQTNCSFVCGLRCKSLEQTAKRWPMHCHGGCGMIHVSKLSKIYDRDGCLPHCKEAMPT